MRVRYLYYLDVAACPVCNTPVVDDFGLIECSNCGAQLLVHMDGRVTFSGSEEVEPPPEEVRPDRTSTVAAHDFAVEKPLEFDFDSSVQENITIARAPTSAKPPPLPSREPKPESESDFSVGEFSEFAPENSADQFQPQIPEGDPDELVDFSIGSEAQMPADDLDATNPIAPSYEGPSLAEPEEFVAHQEPEIPAHEDDPFLAEIAAATRPMPVDEEAPAGEEDAAPTPAPAEDIPDFLADEPPLEQDPVSAPRAPGDISDIAQFGNSEASSSRDGSLRYNLLVTGIDTVDVRDNFREAITDRKLIWDTDQIVRSIRNGEVKITNVSAAKAHIVVSRLRELPVRVTWEQYAIAQS